MLSEHDTLATEIEAPPNPFPGLRPFEFNESHLYFGRDGQSEQLLRKLSARRFIAVVGTSGSGKSSLVRAGLLPALFGGFMPSAGPNWRIAIMRPTNDPVGNLARALNRPGVFGSDIEENAQLQAAITEATLRRGSLGLIEAVRQNRMPTGDNLLVVVDQFEELFRFARITSDEQYQNEAAAFVKLLLEAARQREQAIYVVLTMRSDFLGDCSLFWDLPEAINEGQYLIPRLTREQRREAITGPIAVCGGEIAPRLVNRLLNDMGDDQDQLPILQHALMRTWENWKQDHREGEPIDLRHYEAIGAMDLALSRHADEAFHELPDERSRSVAETVFKALTEKGNDNREIRRPVVLDELCALTGASATEVVVVLEVFRREGRTFLMPPAPTPLDGNSLVDISHESLIRNWERLKKWVDEEARSARIYKRLADTATLYEHGQAGLWRDPDLQQALEWRERQKPNRDWARRYHSEFDAAMGFLNASVAARDAAVLEAETQRRREIRRARRTAVVFGLLFLFALAAFVYAYTQSVKAQAAFRDADKQRQKAEQLKTEAERQKTDAEQQRTLAVDAREQEEVSRRNAEQQAALAQDQKKIAERMAQEARKSEQLAHARQVEAMRASAEAETSRRAAEREKNNALAEEEKNRQLLYAADLNLAQQAYEASNIGRGREVLQEAYQDADQKTVAAASPAEARSSNARSANGPGYEWYYLWRLYHRELDTLPNTGFDLSNVAVSSDGKLMAVASNSSITLWDVAAHREVKSIQDQFGFIKAMTFLPDGQTLVFARQKPEDGPVELWHFTVDQKPRPVELEGIKAVSALALSPDGKLLATTSESKTVLLWDTASYHKLATLSGHNSYVNCLRFSPDGRTLATGSVDQSVRLWSMDSFRELPQSPLMGHLFSVTGVAFSPDGRMLATADYNGLVKLWETGTYNELLKDVPKENTEPITSLAFSPDSKVLAASGGHIVRLWNASTFEELDTLRGHTRLVSSVSFLPDGKTLVSLGEDGVKLWNATPHYLERSTLDARVSSIRAIAYSPDGNVLATAGLRHAVQLWDARSYSLLATLDDSAQASNASGSVEKDSTTGSSSTALTSLAFSRDGRMLAAASENHKVTLWDTSTHQLLATYAGHDAEVWCVAFSADGRRLATGSSDRTVKIWDTSLRGEQHAPLTTLKHFTAVLSLAYSPDGRALATADVDDATASGIVRFWETASYTALPPIKVGSPIGVLAFSPDGKSLAVGGLSNSVGIWNLGTRTLSATLKGHASRIYSVLFSRDGKSIATSANDNTVKLWSTSSYKELITLSFKDTKDNVLSLAFSPDNGTLATGTESGLAMLWPAATPQEVATQIKASQDQK